MMKTLHTIFLVVAFIFVKAQSPTIMFANISKTFGEGSFYMAANSNSSGAMSFSIVSGTAATITQDGLVTIKSAGTSTISVSQEASGSFSSGTKTAVLTVNKATVGAVFITSPNTIGTSDSVKLIATSSPPGAQFNWSIISQNGTSATLNGNTLFAGQNTGSLDIKAEVIADNNFIAGTSSSTSNQLMTVQATSGIPNLIYDDQNTTFGISSFYMTATSNSPADITYSIASGTAASVSSNGLVTILGAGTVTIKASQAATGSFTAINKTATLTIAKAEGILFITSSNLISANDSLNLTANTYPPGVGVKWTIKTQTGTNSSIIGNKLYAGNSTGNLDLMAEIVPDDNFNATSVSSTATQIITVQPNSGIPSITYDDQNTTFGTSPFYMTATSNSPADIMYSITSGTAASVSSSGLVTILGAGTVTIKASQAATGSFTAINKSATLTITKADVGAVSISSSNNIGANDSLNLTAISNPPGATFKWSIVSLNGTSATLKGNKLYAGPNTGSLDIKAEVLADNNFNAGSVSSTASQFIAISSLQTPTISFIDLTRIYGDSPFYITANSNSSGSLTYSVIEGKSAVVNSSGLVTIVGTGYVKIKASQNASGLYTSGSDTATLTVKKANPSITITSSKNLKLNDSLDLTAISMPSGAKFVWSIESQNGTNANIVGNKLFAGTLSGTLEIKASAAFGDTNFLAGSSASMIIIIDTIIKPTIILQNMAATYGSLPFQITAISNSNGKFTYSVFNDSIVSISPTGIVTIKKPGTTTVTVNQEATPQFKESSQSATLTIWKGNVCGVYINAPNKLKINDSLNITVSTNPAGAKVKLSIGSQTGTKATLSDSKLFAGDSVGTLILTAEVVADDYFNAYTSTFTCSNYASQLVSVYSDTEIPTVLSFHDAIGYYRYSSDFKMTATSNSPGAIHYSIDGEPNATISTEGFITIKNLDSLINSTPWELPIKVIASQEASPPYNATTSTATFYVYKYILMGIEESSGSFSKPTVYPNPAKHMIQIRSGKGSGCEATISLYNMNGEVQNTSPIRNGDDYQLDISEIPSGVYSLKMTYCNEVFTQKVVKQ